MLAGHVLSIGLGQGEKAVSGGRLTITCEIDDLSNTVYIYKTPTEDVQSSSHLTFCTLSGGCKDKYPRYDFTVHDTSVEIIIFELKRMEDEQWWTCQTATNENTLSAKRFYLTVHSKLKAALQ